MTDGILRSVTRGSFTSTAPSPVAIPGMFDDAIAAYSFRKLRTAYAGSAVRIRRISDDAEQNLGFDGNGDFDTAAAATFLSATQGRITTWYDQIGSADLVQPTAANQAEYVASGVGGFETIRRGADDIQMTCTTVPGSNNKWSVFAVASLNSTSESNGRLVSFNIGSGADWSSSTNCQFIARDGSTQGILAYHNSNPAGAISVTYNTAHVMAVILDGAFGTMYRDGTAGTPAANASGTIGDGTNSLRIFQNITSGESWRGEISELVLWASDKTSSLTAIDANMGTYYGL